VHSTYFLRHWEKFWAKLRNLFLSNLPQGRFRPLCQGPGIGCRFSSGSKSQYNRVVCKVKTNTAPEPWVWSYTWWDSKKNLQKKYISIQWGWNSKNHQVWWWTEFHSSCLSFFPERLHCRYIYFHCSYLYNYYSYSWTLCIKWWVSAFRTEI